MNSIEKLYNNLLSKLLSKKYSWFIRSQINHVAYNYSHDYLSVIGKFYVDQDWLKKQWMEYNNFSLPHNFEDLTLSEIISNDEFSKELQNDFKSVYSFITGEKIAKYTSFSGIEMVGENSENNTLKEQINRIHSIMNLKEEDEEVDYAVIEITKPISRMSPKYYFQSVPYFKTKEDKIYLKRGSAGTITISTNNIKVLKKFKQSEKEEMEKYLNNLRQGEKKEQKESEITERCWKGYTQKGMKTMFGKRYPNCVKKTK
jgi:hypothetical protein